MQSFTEFVAAVVVHSSAAAYSHFGVPLEPQQPPRLAPVERTVARSAPAKVVKASDCSDEAARVVRI